ncbi:hypothetical protein CYMTET_32495, partial [Cymbomonas tetramitiformis]
LYEWLAGALINTSGLGAEVSEVEESGEDRYELSNGRRGANAKGTQAQSRIKKLARFMVQAAEAITDGNLPKPKPSYATAPAAASVGTKGE